MLSTKLTATSGVRVTPFSSSAARRCARQTGSLSQPSWVTKGSYLVEVEVGEVEPEDVAIQRFQRAVTQTLVINELRRRRRVMTKIEALQAKQNEKGLIKKLNVDPPSWKDTYGDGMDPAPFADYFHGDSDYAEIASNTDPIGDEVLFMDTSEGNPAYGSNMYNGPSSGYMAGNFGTFGGQYGQQYGQQYNYQQTDYNYGVQQPGYDQGGYDAQPGVYTDPQTGYPQQTGYEGQGYGQADNSFYSTPQTGYPQEAYPPAQGGEPQAPAGY